MICLPYPDCLCSTHEQLVCLSTGVHAACLNLSPSPLTAIDFFFEHWVQPLNDFNRFLDLSHLKLVLKFTNSIMVHHFRRFVYMQHRCCSAQLHIWGVCDLCQVSHSLLCLCAN